MIQSYTDTYRCKALITWCIHYDEQQPIDMWNVFPSGYFVLNHLKMCKFILGIQQYLSESLHRTCLHKQIELRFNSSNILTFHKNTEEITFAAHEYWKLRVKLCPYVVLRELPWQKPDSHLHTITGLQIWGSTRLVIVLADNSINPECRSVTEFLTQTFMKITRAMYFSN